MPTNNNIQTNKKCKTLSTLINTFDYLTEEEREQWVEYIRNMKLYSKGKLDIRYFRIYTHGISQLLRAHEQRIMVTQQRINPKGNIIVNHVQNNDMIDNFMQNESKKATRKIKKIKGQK